MICFEFVFLLFNINYFVPECLDPAEFLLVLSQRDTPTAVHASIQESVGAVDMGPFTAVPTIMDNTPGFPDLDSSLSPPSKRSNIANRGTFACVCCMFFPVQSRCFIALWTVFWIRIY